MKLRNSFINVWNDVIFWNDYNGIIHRDDGPAIEYSNGTKLWYKNGLKVSDGKNLQAK